MKRITDFLLASSAPYSMMMKRGGLSEPLPTARMPSWASPLVREPGVMSRMWMPRLEVVWKPSNITTEPRRALVLAERYSSQ